MISIEAVRTTVHQMMPKDSRFMMISGARFIETEHYYLVDYDTAVVPYIIYQNEGYVHWISGKFIDVNQYFIDVDTLNALNNIAHAVAICGNDMNLSQGGIKYNAERHISRGAMDKITNEMRQDTWKKYLTSL